MKLRAIILPVFMIGSAMLADVRPASAQVRFAPTVAWGEDADIAVGARLLVNMSRLFSTYADEGLSSRIDMVLPFDWFLDCSSCTYFEFTPGLILPLTIKDVGPYIGTGLNIARLSVDTPGRDNTDIDVGLGLMGGLLVPIGSFQAFGEARFTMGGSKQTVVTLGLQLGSSRN